MTHEQIAVKMHFGVETSHIDYLPSVEIKLDDDVIIEKQKIKHNDTLSF